MNARNIGLALVLALLLMLAGCQQQPAAQPAQKAGVVYLDPNAAPTATAAPKAQSTAAPAATEAAPVSETAAPEATEAPAEEP